MLRSILEQRHLEDLLPAVNVRVDVLRVTPDQDAALRELVARGEYDRRGVPGVPLLRQHEGHNLYTDVGLAKLAGALAGGTTTVTHFGLGSDDTAAAAGDTALGTEVNVSGITRVASEDEVATAQYYLGSGQLNDETLQEAGLFTGDDLLARFVFDDEDLQPKTNAVAVVFTWTITMGRAA